MLIVLTMIAVELTAMEPYRLSIKKRVFNDKFYPYLDCQTPEQHYFGGGGSGKSVFVADRTVLDLCRTKRNFLVIRKVADTLRTSFFAEIKKSKSKFKLDGYINIRETDMEITGPNGSKILFRGLDNAEKIKSITVPEGIITDIIIEEATELSENDYNMIMTRLRGKCKYVKRVTLLYNTIYRTHWICKRFFNGQNIKHCHNEKILLLHSTYKDNKFLEQQDRDRLESFKEISPYHYMVYALGEWGVLGDLIFTNWSTRDLTKETINTDDVRGGGDFGFTNDPTAVIRTAISRSKKEIYIFKEIYKRGLTNPDIVRESLPIIGDCPSYWDSAEPKSIAELKQNGLNAYGAEKGKDSLLYSIQWLQQYKIIIDESCVNAQNEMSMYQWQKDKKSGETINQPVGVNDHIIAALRYAYSKDRTQGDYVSWI